MAQRSTRPVLDGKVALVIGASRGIGAAVARNFATAGASVVVAARNESQLDSLVDEIVGAGGRAVAVPTDVADDDAVGSLVERTVAEFGRLDAACNNAAADGRAPAPLEHSAIDDLERAWAVNVRGVFVAMRHEIMAMRAGGGGAIVNMSSTAGVQAVAGCAAYVTSKHALEGLTKVAALDHAADGVRVNSLAPGPILTDRLEQAGPDAQKRVAGSVPMRRIGTVDEVAAAAVWLCSDDASFITGARIDIDGGRLAGTPAFTKPTSAS